jgi:gamma-glutamyl-gamma-aminobutyrate hydrolase PuuD
MKFVGHVEGVEEIINAYKILIGIRQHLEYLTESRKTILKLFLNYVRGLGLSSTGLLLSIVVGWNIK